MTALDQLNSELLQCFAELGAVGCLLQAVEGGDAVLGPLVQFIDSSVTDQRVKGMVMSVLKQIGSIDYTDGRAMSEKSRKIIKTYMGLALMFTPSALRPLVKQVKLRSDEYVKLNSNNTADLQTLFHDVGAIISKENSVAVAQKYPKLPELGRILSEIQLPTQ